VVQKHSYSGAKWFRSTVTQEQSGSEAQLLRRLFRSLVVKKLVQERNCSETKLGTGLQTFSAKIPFYTNLNPKFN